GRVVGELQPPVAAVPHTAEHVGDVAVAVRGEEHAVTAAAGEATEHEPVEVAHAAAVDADAGAALPAAILDGLDATVELVGIALADVEGDALVAGATLGAAQGLAQVAAATLEEGVGAAAEIGDLAGRHRTDGDAKIAAEIVAEQAEYLAVGRDA